MLFEMNAERCFVLCEEDQNNWIYREENVNDGMKKMGKDKIQYRKNLTTCRFKRIEKSMSSNH